MNRKKVFNLAFITITSCSFFFKLIVIIIYGNRLTLSSDDLNYIKSAVILLKKGILTYQIINEPSVFVMPGYPLFLAGIFKILGFGFIGLQGVRIIQAILSCITIVLIYLISDILFNKKVAIISSILVAFYPANITTAGLLLTETIFATLLYTLLYFSLRYSENPKYYNFIVLGIIWALLTLFRPTIALFPVILFIYLLIYRKLKVVKMIPFGTVMFLTFALILSPWWIRNYVELGKFIPLSASSGNPMLQGTYIDYRQTPENSIYYKLGKNALDTNTIEVNIAKRRIVSEFKRDFWGYLRWVTLGKTYHFWNGVFYWHDFLKIGVKHVLAFHKLLLLGFVGIIMLLFKDFSKYILPVLIVVYFNLVHCVYMAFDRYAFPLMPILSIFCAYFLLELYTFVRSLKFRLIGSINKI